MLLIDAHVHIYNCFDLEKFFDSAYSNFISAAKNLNSEDNFTGILLLAETSKDNWFNHLAAYADGKPLPDNRTSGNWAFSHTDEDHSLFAKFRDLKSLILIGGRQIVTAEGIEVLALCTPNSFNDGKPILDLIREIEKKDGLPLIPWGIGKWFGSRGRVVKNIINNKNSSSVYLGDNRNRPNFWLQPTLFILARQKGIRVLPGSDPLPFNSESCRPGSYGFSTNLQIDPKKPGRSIKQMLGEAAYMAESQFGRLENSYRFLLNQVRMQIAKKHLKRMHS